MGTFRVFWLSIKDTFDEMFSLVVVNLLWVLINAPLMGLAAFLIVEGATVPGIVVLLLAVLVMAPANAGLYTVAQRVTEGRVVSWRLFFEGFREYLMLSWRVYGIWTLGLILILSNMSFYARMGSNLGSFLLILFVYFLFVWVGLLIYIGPLMLLQSDKRIRVIARNAIFMVFGRPVFTLITLILMALFGVVLGVVSSGLLPLLLTFMFLAIWSFRATMTLIADAEARRATRQEQAAEATNPANTDKGRSGQIRPRD